MRKSIYIVLSKHHVRRMVRNKRPALKQDEIAVLLEFEIPEEVFDTFVPTIQLKVSRDNVVLPKARIVREIDPEEAIASAEKQIQSDNISVKAHSD